MVRLFGKREDIPEAEIGEEFVEVNLMDTDERKVGKLDIKIEKLNDFSDTDRILRSLREGAIIFVKIKGLKEKDMSELKRAIEKLKRGIAANNGDIAGVEQDWLILTPEFAAVHRD
ncbi:MAG: cell division protein SepF [Candidatus Aenigmarchaeota archaeon]|nr:cell division protein SepF [Candidatus Aenigmarchaeota archaeon]